MASRVLVPAFIIEVSPNLRKFGIDHSNIFLAETTFR